VLGDAEFAAWFRLLEIPGLGRDGARKLLAACGSPDAVLAAPPATLRELVGPVLAQALSVQPPSYAERWAAAQQWRKSGDNRHVLTLGAAGYPALLMQTADPPLLLYVQGALALLGARSLAIVGSRAPSPQGRANANTFAQALSQNGLLVVSGLAQGIDGAAHEGALAANSPTVAVVGTGLDRVYPSAHRELARRIAEHGALVSEFAPGTPALPAHFPLRNRIIAGLSLGTLVVEAALRSGSLITARLALEAGREVFAVPGSILSPQSKGCHALIKQGAKLVESAQDILEELAGPRTLPLLGPDDAVSSSGDEAPNRDPAMAAVLAALGFEPTTLDALLARTGESTATLTARLFELEMQGLVARLPGGLFQRCARA
jgi:DNA processing protein